jgi:hypothetical protein
MPKLDMVSHMVSIFYFFASGMKGEGPEKAEKNLNNESFLRYPPSSSFSPKEVAI